VTGADGERVRKMTAVVTVKRARSTWLTATAGLLLLVTAVVMMVCAAPRVHAAQHGSAPRDDLVSWVFLTPGSPVVGPGARTPNGLRP
jgi:hypothetical protein